MLLIFKQLEEIFMRSKSDEEVDNEVDDKADEKQMNNQTLGLN